MTKNIVGIDIDGVLADYLHGISSYAGFMPVSTSTRYDMIEPGLFNSRGHFMGFHKEFVKSGGFRNLKLHDDSASEATDSLKSKGFEVHIITARHGFDDYDDSQVYNDTLSWLKSHGIVFDRLELSPDKCSTGAKFMLDDSPYNVKSLIDGSKTHPIVYRHLYNTYGCDILKGKHIDYVSTVGDFAELVINS